MEGKKFISIICPVFNEGKYIDSLVNSILNQDYGNDKIEVFFIDGLSTDETRYKLELYCKKYPFFCYLENSLRNVPAAMNLGIKKSIGEYIIRIDAHSYYPPDYFSKLIKYAEELKSDNVGGICITDVKNKTNKSIAIKEVLSNRFGVGNSMFRIGSDKILEVDTVVFGCFKKNVFDRFGFYDERLIRNQDIELNKRIKLGGGKLFQVPDIHCTYFARENFIDFMKNNFSNGLWNIYTLYYTNNLKSLSPRHMIPLIFILSLLIPSLFSIYYKPFSYLTFTILTIYLLIIFLNSIYISFIKKVNFFYLFISFIFLHFSYGFGSLLAIIRLPFLKNAL
jgi:glycosyltransferase involved in cell wall biosynthesis